MPNVIETDAIVIGAGPVGLFQVFQLGLLGVQAHVVDVLPQAGGQCIALYPDKPIYDVPGVPRCTGRELVAQLLEQAAPFLRLHDEGALSHNVHLGHLVAQLTPQDGRYELTTDRGVVLRAPLVFVAAGAGAFVPKTLNIEALQAAHSPPTGLYHHLPEAGVVPPWAGADLVVHGGGDEALSAVLSVLTAPHEHRPARLRLLHRRDQFQADAALNEQVREAMVQGQLELIIGMPVDAGVADGALQWLDVLGPDGQTQRTPMQHLLIQLGMSPKLGPLTQWGMDLARKQVAVSAATFESSLGGVYAVGDINTYPGKKRLLLCGFHEATLAAHDAAAKLHPDAPQHLLYTTTSPLLHTRLGVSS
jgi:thioredoxin reductase (NADPH)